MPKISNLVKETTTTTGTGNLTTSSANGYSSFNTAFGNGSETNRFYYYIIDETNGAWEYGTGHMSAATTLVRDTVIGSTNSNALVSFGAGTKTITCDQPAEVRTTDGRVMALLYPQFV